MTFIKAYQVYQQGHYDHCLKILQDIKQNDSKKLSLQAQAYFRKKEYQKAYDIYVNLLKRDSKNAEAYRENILTLIVCAQLEQPGSLNLVQGDELPSLDDIIEQVELIDLGHENKLVFPPSESTKKSRKQKKRRKRLPKQYDPVAGPDPERWLPRRDRKANVYKQRKRRPRQSVKGKPRPK